MKFIEIDENRVVNLEKVDGIEVARPDDFAESGKFVVRFWFGIDYIDSMTFETKEAAENFMKSILERLPHEEYLRDTLPESTQ